MSIAAAVALDLSRPAVRFAGKYLSVTTFRRSGEPVSTPVWFVELDGQLYVDTDAESGKVKRIRGNPRVLLAPCSASGKLKAAQVSATAQIVGEMSAAVRDVYSRKYRMDRIFFLPAYRLVQALKRRGVREQLPVVIVITPGEAVVDGVRRDHRP